MTDEKTINYNPNEIKKKLEGEFLSKYSKHILGNLLPPEQKNNYFKLSRDVIYKNDQLNVDFYDILDSKISQAIEINNQKYNNNFDFIKAFSGTTKRLVYSRIVETLHLCSREFEKDFDRIEQIGTRHGRYLQIPITFALSFFDSVNESYRQFLKPADYKRTQIYIKNALAIFVKSFIENYNYISSEKPKYSTIVNISKDRVINRIFGFCVFCIGIFILFFQYYHSDNKTFVSFFGMETDLFTVFSISLSLFGIIIFLDNHAKKYLEIFISIFRRKK